MKNIYRKFSRLDSEYNFEDVYDETAILEKFGIQKFENILFVGLNKNTFIENYIKKNQFNYLNLFDPSADKLGNFKNVLKNKFLPHAPKEFNQYFAKSENDSNATFFKKDLRWIAYNDDRRFVLKNKKYDLVNEHYDLLFLSLNGSELNYLKNLEKLVKNFKIIKFEFTEFSIDSKTHLKDYFMFFYQHDFLSFQNLNRKIIRLNKYDPLLEGSFKKVYYFINQEFLTKVNFKSSYKYTLKNYVIRENTPQFKKTF